MKKQFIFIQTLLALLLFFSSNLQAQDLHFSQYFNNPLIVNPANTGFAPDVDWRAGVSYRNQFSSLTANPYKTMSAWGDMQLFNDRFENGWVGVGGAILKDVAGAGSLTSTRGFGSVAYHQMVGFASLLSVGFNVGYISKSVDVTKLTFNNQWNGKFFDVGIPSGENFAYSKVGYFDLQAGINYAFFPNDNTYLNAGFSASHINRPTESFFDNSATPTIDNRLDIRYTAFLNAAYKFNDQVIINPNAYVSKMGNAWEVVAGLNANYNLSGDGTKQLIGGLYVRGKDAAIPMVGFQLNDYKITVSYDATTSALGNYNNRYGAYELSLVKTGLYNNNGKALKCPSVKF